MKGELTELLLDWKAGNPQASEAIFSMVYGRLSEIAHVHLAREHDDITFQPSDLVHEVFLRMVDQTRIDASDRNHFFSIASRCMRQILVDYARKKKSEKRGGGQKTVTLDENIALEEQATEEIIEIDQALVKLSQLDKRMAKVTELHFFGGLSISETAEVMGVSTSTIDREWKKAKLWVYQFITEQKE